MRLSRKAAHTRTRSKTRPSKVQELHHEAKRMVISCGILTVLLLLTGIVWARYRIGTAGYVHTRSLS
jgi:hypothetical protein